MPASSPDVLGLFGGAVRQQREARGLSQERLAHLAGLHRTYSGSLERGERNVGIRNVYALAKALDVDPGELLPPLTVG